MSATNTVTVRSVAESSISEEVVYAVAEATGADPTEMPPLYDVIDPQALDRLFDDRSEGGATPTRVVFTVSDCEVTVHGDGEVVVRSASNTADSENP